MSQMFNYIILYYYNMNIIWENKGIILGIISYLIENHKQLKDNKIIIKNTKFNNVISNLFPNMKIMDNGSGFKINIKNQKNSGLIINNLQNLSIINAEKITILPWFDKDNPIIMYLYTKKEIYDKNFLKTEINIFNEKERFIPRQQIDFQYTEFIQQHCGLNIWDTYTEYDILLSYIQYYPNNIFKINQYIDNEIGGLYCNKPSFIMVPINNAIPYETQKHEIHNNPVKHKVSMSVNMATNKSCQYINIDKLIYIITNIIRHINKVLEIRLMEILETK